MLARLGDWPVVYGLLRNAWDSPALRRRLYGPRLLDAPLPDAFEWLRSAWPAHADPLSALAEFEWSNKMVNDLLWHEDRVSMANGVEVRVPFVDSRLRAWVDAHEARLPAAQRLGKRTLRAAVGAVVPAAVLTRPKSGFQLDAPRFVQGPLAAYADHWLADARVRDIGLFDPAGVRALRALPARRGHRWHYFMLYLMAQSQHWVDAFERGSMLDPLLHDAPPLAGVTDASRG
jgi:asparagine synthase (glutamine-hydrolysing)